MQMPVIWLRKTVCIAVSIKHTASVREASAMRRMGAKEQQQQRPRQFWLLKTEPDEWSWQNQEANSGLSVWDGVRNHQAQNMMKSMAVDDLCFFYHTGKLKEVAGIVRVVKTFYPDPTVDSEKWGAVDVKEVEAFKQPVTLAQMKDDDHFKDFKMLRQPRLSVVPVDESIWKRVCELGGVESAESLGAVKEERTKSGPAKKKKAEVKGEREAEKIETGKPAKNATKAPNLKKSKGSTQERPVETAKNGSAEKRQTKAGGRKRGAKEVNESSRETRKQNHSALRCAEITETYSKVDNYDKLHLEGEFKHYRPDETEKRAASVSLAAKNGR